LLSNIFNWLNPHKLDFSTMKPAAGIPFNIYLKPETKNFKIRAPHQKWEKYPAVLNPFKYTETKNVGIYTISENNKWRYFAVNLVDESESDIKPSSPQAMPGNSDGTPDPEKIGRQQPLWSYCLLLVLGLLFLEWYVWLKTG
jgi:hypothetical protein